MGIGGNAGGRAAGDGQALRGTAWQAVLEGP